MLRDAFKKEETNSRCEDAALKSYVRDLRGNDLDRGIVNNTGRKWQEQVMKNVTLFRLLVPHVNKDNNLK